MKILIVLAVVVGGVYSTVDWMDLHVGNSQLPSYKEEALKNGWKPVLNNNKLKITWYMRNNDQALMVAFDMRNNIAGVKFNFLKSELDAAYLGVYTKSDIFDETSKYLTFTVLFSPNGVLKAGGRRKLDSDEIALGAYVKRRSFYQHIDREGCQHEETGVVEQGCQPQYGLVFSDFDSSSNCDSLSPFYTIWDTQETGNLIGFGLLTFGKNIPNSKPLSPDTVKAMFPHRPACLDTAAQNGLSAVEVWLSKSTSEMSKCDNGEESWTSLHCDRNMRSMYTIL